MADRLTHRMRELTNTVFRPQFVDGVFSNAQSRLRERLVLEGREAELPPVQRAVDSTLQRTRQRMAAFVSQRYQPPQPGEFDSNDRMRLTDWSSSSPEQEGYATRIEAAEGTSVFRITASAVEGRTSLQKRILLAPGLYQWEARVRTRSVSGFGACLDVEWGRRGQRFDEGSTPLQSVTSTADWTLLKREILIPARGEGGRRRPGGPMGENGSSPREIILHAELRADSGTAEFDADAFVLSKR